MRHLIIDGISEARRIVFPLFWMINVGLKMLIYTPKINEVTEAKPEFELVFVLFCSL